MRKRQVDDASDCASTEERTEEKFYVHFDNNRMTIRFSKKNKLHAAVLDANEAHKWVCGNQVVFKRSAEDYGAYAREDKWERGTLLARVSNIEGAWIVLAEAHGEYRPLLIRESYNLTLVTELSPVGSFCAWEKWDTSCYPGKYLIDAGKYQPGAFFWAKPRRALLCKGQRYVACMLSREQEPHFPAEDSTFNNFDIVHEDKLICVQQAQDTLTANNRVYVYDGHDMWWPAQTLSNVIRERRAKSAMIEVKVGKDVPKKMTLDHVLVAVQEN